MLDLPRVSLCILPTPLHRLDRVSADLGIDLWIKRDDLTGFALGGNKGRKLEFHIGDALRQGAEVVVTCGSVQSNFVRQLTAACAVAGLKCAAALMHHPYEPFDGEGPRSPNETQEGQLSDWSGNMALNSWLDADLRIYPDGPWESLYELARGIAVEYGVRGLRTYEIPVGGSSALGAYGFWLAAHEVDGFDTIVTASSSGSTQVGLATALQRTGTRLLGIACDPEPELPNDFARLSHDLVALLGQGRPVEADEFEFLMDYVGPGYGYSSESGNAAIAYLARTEGIFLDPIYSGKAFAGLIDLARKRQISGRILFWHTGGTPALFA